MNTDKATIVSNVSDALYKLVEQQHDENLFDELTYSDLTGVLMVEAQHIVDYVLSEVSA